MSRPEEVSMQLPEDCVAPGGDAVQRVFEKVREYENLLNSVGEVSDDEKAAIINSLDSQWPFFGETVRVTGNVPIGKKIETENEADGGTKIDDRLSVSFETGTTFIEDMQLTSMGFNYYERPVVVAGETISTEKIIGLYFHVKDELIAPNMLLSQYIRVNAVGRLDDLIVEYPENPHDLIPHVTYYFPDGVTDIDCAVLNATDEVEAVESLGNVTVEVNHDATPEAIGLLARYASGLVEFDKQIPYDIAFTGLFYKVDDDNGTESGSSTLTPLFVTEPLQWWAYPKAIEVIPCAQPKDGRLEIDNSRKAFGLRLAVLSREGNDASMSTLVIPITSDFVMASIRKVYYTAK